MAATYFGLHATALSRGREWFRRPEWPPLAAWWFEGDHVPDLQEAVVQHQYLHENGPTARVFNFKQPFDTSGEASKIDRDRMKAIAERNSMA